MSARKTLDFNGRNQQKNRRIFSVCHIWYKNCKRISRVLFGKFLFRCDHLSRTHVTVRLQLPLRHDGRRISLFCGIAPDRVYTDRRRYRRPGGLLPRLFTLTDCSDVLFCCTVPGVASGGRYPLSLPMGARTFLRENLSAHPRDRTACSILSFFCRYLQLTKRWHRPNRDAAECLFRHLRRSIRPERRPNQQVFCELCGIFLLREQFFPS